MFERRRSVVDGFETRAFEISVHACSEVLATVSGT